MSAVLGVVCGMQAEAGALGHWAEDARIALAVTAGHPDRAEAEAGRLARAGVRALISWGICGGLDPALHSGALLVPDGVILPGGQPYAFESGLVAACRAAAPVTGRQAAALGQPASAGPARAYGGILLLAGSDAVLFRPDGKAALRRRSGAAAVDMESHRVAAAARRSKMPCVAIRAVSDMADRRLPALAAHALDASGRPRAGAVLGGLLRRPWDLPALVAAGRDSRAALTSLASAADAVIPAMLSRLSAPPES